MKAKDVGRLSDCRTPDDYWTFFGSNGRKNAVLPEFLTILPTIRRFPSGVTTEPNDRQNRQNQTTDRTDRTKRPTEPNEPIDHHSWLLMLFGDIFLHIGNIGDLNSRETWIAGRLEEPEDLKTWETWINVRLEYLGDLDCRKTRISWNLR